MLVVRVCVKDDDEDNDYEDERNETQQQIIAQSTRRQEPETETETIHTTTRDHLQYTRIQSTEEKEQLKTTGNQPELVTLSSPCQQTDLPWGPKDWQPQTLPICSQELNFEEMTFLVRIRSNRKEEEDVKREVYI